MSDHVRADDTLRRDRAAGLMLGAAVGDALGAPFEFGPAGAYSARFPRPCTDGPGEMIGGGVFGWEPGEFTDDTQMAVLLAASLVERGGYDPDDVWARWRTWAADAVDVGSTIRTALRAPDWRAVAHADVERTAGNGAVMRSFPLAIATLGLDDARARDIVTHQARLTHHHVDAADGAWLAVAMMRIGLAGGDVAAALATLEREVRGMSPRLQRMLAADWTPADTEVGNGSVWGCLAQAVWAIRGAADGRGVEAALTTVIDLGADTDTVACVTGAIAGSLCGAGAIPVRWRTHVHGRVRTHTGVQQLGPDELTGLARDLVSLGRTALPAMLGEDR